MCDISKYLTERGHTSKSRGNLRKFICPFHNDTDPSLMVWEDKNRWWCFSCMIGGTFVAMIRYYEFRELPEKDAYRKAYERMREMGHEPELRAHTVLPLLAPVSKLRKPALAMAVAHYENELEQNPEAIKYLANRGIDIDTAKVFRLGYCPGTEESAAILGSYSEIKQELITLGVLYPLDHKRAGQEIMFKRIIIPNLRHGEPVWFQGRTIRDSKVRYLSIRGPKAGLYGFDTLSREGPKFIAEGAFDVMPFLKAGYGGVALLGTYDNLSILGHRLAGQNIVVLRDEGDGGKIMTDGVKKSLRGLAKSIVVIDPPEGMGDAGKWTAVVGISQVIAEIRKKIG